MHRGRPNSTVARIESFVCSFTQIRDRSFLIEHFMKMQENITLIDGLSTVYNQSIVLNDTLPKCFSGQFICKQPLAIIASQMKLRTRVEIVYIIQNHVAKFP